MENKDIDFIARRYRAHRFNAAAGWKKLGLGHGALWRRWRVAASIAAVAVLSASAVLIYNVVRTPAPQQAAPAVEIVAPDAMAVKVIDFENAPLTAVVEKINEVYGVKVTGLPARPDDYRLSLHYEGTAADLVETINDILGTDLKVEKQ